LRKQNIQTFKLLKETKMKTFFSIPRQQALEAFRHYSARARWQWVFGTLFGRAEKKSLPGPDEFPQHVNRKLVGMQDIPVEQIAGSLNRNKDFDAEFRPLRDHLRERWVDAYLQKDVNSWPPVRLHQIDGTYFVEDGHHRVSVARCTGVHFIQAEVWNYEKPKRSFARPRTVTTLEKSICGCPQGAEAHT
jgi:hypothetical protein